VTRKYLGPGRSQSTGALRRLKTAPEARQNLPWSDSSSPDLVAAQVDRNHRRPGGHSPGFQRTRNPVGCFQASSLGIQQVHSGQSIDSVLNGGNLVTLRRTFAGLRVPEQGLTLREPPHKIDRAPSLLRGTSIRMAPAGQAIPSRANRSGRRPWASSKLSSTARNEPTPLWRISDDS
jgi:hypothetical protein